MKARTFLTILSGFLVTAGMVAAAPVQQSWVGHAFPRQSEPKALVLDGAGRLIVAGTIVGNDYGTAKFDIDGALLWERSYEGPPPSSDNVAGVAVDNTGNVYVTGGSAVSGMGEDFATVKYAPDGTELWVRRFHGPETGGGASGVAVDGAGNVVVTGTSVGTGTAADIVTIKYTRDGTELWVARFDGIGQSDDRAVALAVDSGGNVYVVGSSRSAGASSDYVTVKYDPSGNQVWATRYDGSDQLDEWPVALALTPDGGVAVTGTSRRGPVGYGYPLRSELATVKYEANGTQSWLARYRSVDALQPEVKSLAVDGSGNIVIAGAVCGNCDFLAVKYDAAGNEVYVSRQGVGDHTYEYLRGLALDGGGNAYLTGAANIDGINQFATLKLDVKGNRLWQALFAGDGNFDWAAGVALDGAGGVYVAGTSRYFEGEGGYTVVKYEQGSRAGWPTITAGPAHQTVLSEGTVTFGVSATGTPPLTYQWRYQGLTIADATNATLTLTNVQFWQRGDYSVVISNALGDTVSPEAHLTVLIPPFVTQQPADQFAYLGTTASFSLEADGTEPLAYQWRRGSDPIPGATNATLILPNLQAADAGEYVAVVSNPAGSITSAVVRLTVSPQLQQLWARQNTALGNNSPPFLKVDSAGNSYLASVAYEALAVEDLLAQKYDPQGNLLWSVGYDSGFGDGLMAMALDSAGNVYLAGGSGTPDGSSDFRVVKFTTAGNLAWAAAYNGSNIGYETATAIAVNGAGEVYVAGESDGRIVTVKLSASGQQLWNATYDRNGSVEDFLVTLALGNDGSAFVSSAIWSENSSSDLVVLKYDSSGSETWAVRFDGGSQDRAIAMATDNSGAVYVSETAVDSSNCGGTTGYDFVTAKFAPNDGSLIWTARYVGENANNSPSAMAVDSAGRVYVTGQSIERVGYRSSAVTVAYDSAGRQRWSAVEPSCGNGGSRNLELDSAGNVYIAFTLFHPGTRAGFSTVKYDPTGIRLWQVFHGGDGREHFASGLGLDSADHVYVAGQSFSQFGKTDFELVKYQQNSVPGEPIITSPPRDVEVALGGTATFTVTVTGADPLLYQWRFNGIPITDATNSSLMVFDAANQHEGGYSVDVSNPIGRIRSAEAQLTIVFPPSIDTHPLSQATVLGGGASFFVGASGSGELRYQWHLNGQPLAGATNAVYAITNAQPADAGTYTVEVSNSVGAMTSQPGRLTVSQAVAQCDSLALPPGGRSPLIQTDGSGNLYSASMGEGVTKRDATGQVLWSAPYPGLPVGFALGPNGSVYVTGYSNGVTMFMPGQTNLLTARYDANGNLLWSRLDVSGTIAFWLSSADYPIRLKVDSAGNAVVLDDVLRKFGPNGDLLWVEGCCGISIDVGLDAAQNIYVTHVSGGPLVTRKFSPAGTELWAVSRDDMNWTTADMTVDNAGNVYLTSLPQWGGGGDVVIVKYDSAGDQLWQARYPGPTVGSYGADAIALDPAGNVYVSGLRNPGIVTLKHSPAGQLLWVTRHNAGAVRSITSDGFDGLFVTAAAPGATGTDLLTIRYDSAGNQLWVARTAGPLGDFSTLSVQAVGNPGEFFVSTMVETTPVIIKYCQQGLEGLPTILSPPQSQSVIAYNQVTFSVTAAGAAPLGYQWTRDGRVLDGATGSTLTVPSAATEDAGEYAVEVFNSLGSVVSPSAVLEVRVPPAIVHAPLSQCVVSGMDVRLQVEAAGDRPLSYQWRFNGVDLPGATNTLLLLSSVQPGQSGVYSVVARNWAGTAAASADVTVSGRGRQEWTRTFTGPGDRFDVPNASAIDSGGNVIITGRSGLDDFSSGYDIVTRKYDTTGALVWERRYINTNSPARFADAHDITVDSANNVYVVGATYDPFLTYLTLKYDAAGALLWERRHTAGSHDSATAVVVDHAGSVIVTGSGLDAASFRWDYLTVKYDANGNFLWQARHDGPAGQSDAAWDVAVDAANNIYVAGEVQTSPNPNGEATRDWALVKYSPGGVQQWVTRLDGGLNTRASRPALAVDSAGNAHVTGLFFTNGVADFLVVKYDTTGSTLWSFRYDSPTHGEDRATDLTLDAAGNVYVTGYSQLGNYDGLTLKLNSAGQKIWEARYREPRPLDGTLGLPNKTKVPRAITLDTAGNVIITGTSDPSGTVFRDIFTVKYDPNGNQLWSALTTGQRQISGLSEDAVNVHADAAGNVFVTGMIVDHGTDYLIVKYASATVPGAPVITTPPQDQAVMPGADVTLAVVATGDASLQYQWRFNGLPIPGATDSTLRLSLVSSADVGTYSVEVRNGLDCTQSPEATLTLAPPAAPHLSGLRRLPDGRFALRLSGERGFNYRLETSADLRTWVPILESFNVTGVIEFVEPDSADHAQRFYRAVKLSP